MAGVNSADSVSQGITTPSRGTFNVSMLGISFDITESVLTRRALKEEEERYRQLFEGAGDCIFLMKDNVFID